MNKLKLCVACASVLATLVLAPAASAWAPAATAPVHPGVQVFTRGQQVKVPSETLLEFRLQQPATVAATQR